MITLFNSLDEKEKKRAIYHTSVGNMEFFRLALLGDAILNLYLIEKFYDEREIGKLLSEYKSNKALGIVVEKTGLYRLLVAKEDSISEYTYASMFEAILGLLYEHYDLKDIFRSLDEEIFPIMKSNYDEFRNYWEELRSMGDFDVEFESVGEEYKAKMQLNGKTFYAFAKNKKEARNRLAKEVLKYYGKDISSL